MNMHSLHPPEIQPTLEPPEARPPHLERRRPGWREFRHSYPGILATMAVALLIFLAIDGWLIYKQQKYRSEVARLRAGMSDFERRQTDVLLASDENRLRIMVELIRRQAEGDKQLHLAISADSGIMYLQREGAKLREMETETGPERTVGTPPDTVRMAVPRGTRTVERILRASDAWEVPAWVYTDRGLAVPTQRSVKGALGPIAIVLNGGTVIYSFPDAGPLNDSSYVLPGGVRAKAADLRAVVPNLKPGMTVYFY
jgi:hypothetical protein